MGLTYRVRIKQDGNDFVATTKVPICVEMGEIMNITIKNDDAYYAFLSIKQGLDLMGVKGTVEPEFIKKDEKGDWVTGQGFYGMTPAQEAMPLKAGR